MYIRLEYFANVIYVQSVSNPQQIITVPHNFLKTKM